jgi:hypothetical protein
MCIHINDELLSEDKKMDQTKIEHVARLGGDWYCKVSAENLFKVAKPNAQLGIGIDVLPQAIRNSKILSGNHLGQLGNVHEMPLIQASFEDEHLKNIVQYFSIDPADMEREIHGYAGKLLDAGKIEEAWQVLLAAENI